jgi:2',3'-cyclic-nucleotide 2'-phosphodiesterase (5'-nucleotidase family)
MSIFIIFRLQGSSIIPPQDIDIYNKKVYFGKCKIKNIENSFKKGNVTIYKMYQLCLFPNYMLEREVTNQQYY